MILKAIFTLNQKLRKLNRLLDYIKKLGCREEKRQKNKKNEKNQKKKRNKSSRSVCNKSWQIKKNNN